MTSNWYLIDDDGAHAIDFGGRGGDFWTTFNRNSTDEVWPAFTQLVIEAPVEAVVRNVLDCGVEMGTPFVDVTAQPELWAEGLYLAREGDLTLLSEPLTELEDRFIGASTGELIVAQLHCAGAYFGYDPAQGTLFLTMFENGLPTFAWSDSLLPGPSYALVFGPNGTCTHEDPRRFALRMMDQPETSPLLDRYAFVESCLRSIGVDPVCPDLKDLPIAAVLNAE